MTIKVVVIEDQKELREMLAVLITGSEGFECVATFERAEEAITEIPQLLPDVALVDIHLPGKSGIALIDVLKSQVIDTKFVICSSLDDDTNIFNALKAGADGYISKTSSPVKILEAIQDVFNGGSPMSSQIARRVVSYFNPKKELNSDLNKLSAREQEILQYLSKGYRYKEVAGFLFISIETVRKHIHNIYDKLQVSSRTDALNKISKGNNPDFF